MYRALSLCFSCKKYTTKMSVQNTPDASYLISPSVQKFSAEFYKFLAQEVEGNVVCSPVSVAIILGMITFGARGKTEKELRSSLCLPSDETVIRTGITFLINSLNNFQEVELNFVNKLFIQKGFEIIPEFKVITQTSFQSELESIDFSDTEGSSKIINSWCEEKTNNRIRDVVQPDVLEDAKLILINAIYFKGEWANPFSSRSTQPQPFSISENVTKTVQMMFTDDDFNFGDLLDFKAQYIELPYKEKDDNDATSLYIILPEKIEGLQEVEANLDKIDFSKLQGPPQRVLLYLPKFRIESKLDLRTVLSKMGINDAFEDNANFTGIAEGPPLKISKILQKSFITVNERGTEAGAVTDSRMMLISLPPCFIADKPFLCVLVAKSTGTPIFIGKVVDPTLAS